MCIIVRKKRVRFNLPQGSGDQIFLILHIVFTCKKRERERKRLT